jgi:hypothetical protein
LHIPLNCCPGLLKRERLAGKALASQKTKRLALQGFCSDTIIDICKNMAHTNLSDVRTEFTLVIRR